MVELITDQLLLSNNCFTLCTYTAAWQAYDDMLADITCMFRSSMLSEGPMVADALDLL